MSLSLVRFGFMVQVVLVVGGVHSVGASWVQASNNEDCNSACASHGSACDIEPFKMHIMSDATNCAGAAFSGYNCVQCITRYVHDPRGDTPSVEWTGTGNDYVCYPSDGTAAKCEAKSIQTNNRLCYCGASLVVSPKAAANSQAVVAAEKPLKMKVADMPWVQAPKNTDCNSACTSHGSRCDLPTMEAHIRSDAADCDGAAFSGYNCVQCVKHLYRRSRDTPSVEWTGKGNDYVCYPSDGTTTTCEDKSIPTNSRLCYCGASSESISVYINIEPCAQGDEACWQRAKGKSFGGSFYQIDAPSVPTPGNDCELAATPILGVRPFQVSMQASSDLACSLGVNWPDGSSTTCTLKVEFLSGGGKRWTNTCTQALKGFPQPFERVPAGEIHVYRNPKPPALPWVQAPKNTDCNSACASHGSKCDLPTMEAHIRSDAANCDGAAFLGYNCVQCIKHLYRRSRDTPSVEWTGKGNDYVCYPSDGTTTTCEDKSIPTNSRLCYCGSNQASPTMLV